MVLWFAYAKTKTQIRFAVTAKLISAFVFATRLVQFLYYLNPKFEGSSHLLGLHSPAYVGPGRNRRRPVFSQRVSFACDPMLRFYIFCMFFCTKHGHFNTYLVISFFLLTVETRCSVRTHIVSFLFFFGND